MVLPGDNQFRVVSGTGTFVQFAKTDFLPTDSAFLTAIASNTQLQFDYRTFTADNSGAGDFNLRFVVNTNANGFGYQGVQQIYIANPSGANSSGTFVWDYSTNATFLAALDDYRTGTSGTFFEFFLDNSGFPNIDSAVTFSIDNIAAIPEPSTWALLAGGLALLTLTRRLRVQAAKTQ